MENSKSLFQKLLCFYFDGFRSMSGWGRKVWIIIIIKLFIIFVILRIFFFHGYLEKNYKNDKDRGEHVLDQLIN
jgi:uncharacterized membrane protein